MPLGLKIILATVGALVVIGASAFGALFLLNGQFDSATETPTASQSPRRTSSAGPTPTASRSTQPRPTSATSTRPPPTSRPPITRPPTSRPPTTRPPARPPHLQPQQGYAPVPLPGYPGSDSEAVQAAKNAALYREKVSKSNCSKMPDLTGHPYGNVSAKKMRSRLQIMADCAAAMWKKPLAEAGFQATKVRILVYSGDGKSPCGTTPFGTASAFYCSANQQIYMEKGLGASHDQDGYLWGDYLMVMDHEFGHHIQARSGILAGAHTLENSASKRSASLEMRRRIELQANCFSGMAMKQSGQVSGSLARRLFDWGDDSDTHGSADHAFGWGIQGFRYREIYQCNTFAAPSKDVR